MHSLVGVRVCQQQYLLETFMLPGCWQHVFLMSAEQAVSLSRLKGSSEDSCMHTFPPFFLNSFQLFEVLNVTQCSEEIFFHQQEYLITTRIATNEQFYFT